MDKIYDILLKADEEIIQNTNEPFCLMRSNEILGESHFTIWRLAYNHQNIHTHDYYQIWYILKGHCEHKIDNHNFTLIEGDLIVIPPFSYHSMHNGSDDLMVVGIDFSETFLSAIDNDNSILMSCINPLFLREKERVSIFNSDKYLKDLITEMFKEYYDRTTFYEVIIKSNLLKLIVMLERMSLRDEDTQTDGHKLAVAEVLKYIHNNISTKIKIEDICETTNLSPTSLGVYFKKITGKTVIEYINTIKIDKAKQLLKETDMNITSISYELGFNDSAYFNRVFKKITSLSPKDYRKKHLNA